MTSGWGWRCARAGARRSPTFLRFSSFGVAVPWVTLVILLVLLHAVSGSLTAADGVLFNLPEAGLMEREKTDLVALALDMPSGTLVFFDDARYALGDGASESTLGERLSERVRRSAQTSLLILADRNVASGDLMGLAVLARRAGVTRVLIANKRAEVRPE